MLKREEATVKKLQKDETDREYPLQIGLIEEKFLLKIHTDFLSDLGHEVYPFNSVSEMLEAQDETPSPLNVILINVLMSQKECISTIGKIRKRFPETPLILMSENLTREEASSCGVNLYIDEPMNLSKLEFSLLEIQRNHRDLNETTWVQPKNIKEIM